MLIDAFPTNAYFSSAVLYFDIDFGLLRLIDLKMRLMVGVTGRQGMLTPPRPMIPPSVRVCHTLEFFLLVLKYVVFIYIYYMRV
jgi:hypothetical protein